MYTGHADQYFGNITYSQHGEDLMLLNFFQQLGIDKPSYLDLGAHHPTHISNTKLLYDRGCRGVNIEANPYLIHTFNMERPEDVNINIGVGLSEGEVAFYMFDAHSGLNTFSLVQAQIVMKESGRFIKDTKLLKVKTLTQIVTEYCGGKFPQFLNCDIEGMDFPILYETLPSAILPSDVWSQPIIICVETRYKDAHSMTEMLGEKGYTAYVRMGENIIYVEHNAACKLMWNMGA